MKAPCSTDRAAALAATIEALLSPHDFPTTRTWRETVCVRFQSLIQNDTTLFVLPEDPDPLFAHAAPHDLQSRGMEFYDRDPANAAVAAFGRRAWTQREVVAAAPGSWKTYYSLDIFHGYHKPLQLLDAAGVYAGNHGGMGEVALLIAYANTLGASCCDERANDITRLLWAPLTAGWSSWRTTAGHDLAAAIDSLGAGLAVYRAGDRARPAHCAHRNPVLDRWLGGPAGHQLEGAIRRVVAAAARSIQGRSVTGSTTEVVNGAGIRFDVHASLGRTPFGRPDAVLVCVNHTPRASRCPSDTRGITDRFGLSPAEARIGVLLAEGHSNNAIASLLRISPHTARHHTERILRKLAVDSRSKVAARLGPLLTSSAPAKSS